MDERLKKIHELLCLMTRDCRRDMHEPDEQGLSAKVVGEHLDNAFGASPYHLDGSLNGELNVCLMREDGDVQNVNLADLIALARMAK